VVDAKRLAQLAPDAKTTVYPRPRNWIEKLQDSLGGGDARVTQALVAELAGVGFEGELLGVIRALRAWRQERVLTWMPLIVRVQ
jgi:hypothetical protein